MGAGTNLFSSYLLGQGTQATDRPVIQPYADWKMGEISAEVWLSIPTDSTGRWNTAGHELDLSAWRTVGQWTGGILYIHGPTGVNFVSPSLQWQSKFGLSVKLEHYFGRIGRNGLPGGNLLHLDQQVGKHLVASVIGDDGAFAGKAGVIGQAKVTVPLPRLNKLALVGRVSTPLQSANDGRKFVAVGGIATTF